MGVKLGALLEVILFVANIGTAVVLYPLFKRQNSIVAVGYVAARVVESTIIAVGILSVLSVVTLRQDFAGTAGADAASLVTVGSGLIGGPLLIVSFVAVLFGVYEQGSLWSSIAVIPEFLWEL